MELWGSGTCCYLVIAGQARPGNGETREARGGGVIATDHFAHPGFGVVGCTWNSRLCCLDWKERGF